MRRIRPHAFFGVANRSEGMVFMDHSRKGAGKYWVLGQARLRAETVLFFVMGWHRVVGMRQACSESGSGYQMKKFYKNEIE